jgi:DNA replication protein DnaC
MMTHPLLPKLRELDLSGMVLTLDVRAAQATENHLTPPEFLALLLDDELERRSQQRLARRFLESGCDSNKSLPSFDFSAVPGVNRTLIQELATCAFVPRHENILLCGPTGVGKSHLANAIACEALKRDFRVLARPTHRLLADLHATRSTGMHHRLLAKVLTCDLLLLDDFGLQPLSPQAVQDLYEVIVERYEHRSLIITSNRAFEEWTEVFNNDLLASAALDRLTHHAHALTIQGQSYRQLNRRKQALSTPPARPATLP